MRKMVRNRVAGEAIEGVQTHFEEYGSLYMAGAVGFLLGGFTIMALGGGRSKDRIIVIK